MTSLTLQVNGREVRAEVDDQMLLVELLRGPLALTGTHVGCDTSQCGACTVLAVQAQGRRVTTIEGLASEGRLHPVQDAFVACHGLQCGFCTPGMVMSAVCLLAEKAAPSAAEIADALEGNLCRCTGYVNIVQAVQHAARALAEGKA